MEKLSTKIVNSVNELKETINSAVAELKDTIKVNLGALESVKQNLACAHGEMEEIFGIADDLSIAMENLWLETDAQGLGGVWLGIAPQEERMKAVEEILDIPDKMRAFAIFPYGYPAEERQQQDRFDESRIHYVE